MGRDDHASNNELGMNLIEIASPRIRRATTREVLQCSPLGFAIGSGSRGIGTSGGGATYNPSSLNFTAWFRGSYGGSPWNGTASGGGSGSETLSEATNPPAVGASLNGYTPADLDGTNDKLAWSGNVADFILGLNFSFAALVNMDAAFADPGATNWTSPAFLGASDSGHDIQFCYTSSGFRIEWFNGATDEYVTSAASTGSWHFLQARMGSSTLEYRVDSAAWSNAGVGSFGVTEGAHAAVTGPRADGGTTFLNGKVMEIMTAQERFSDATFTNLVSYVNGRYALSL